MRTEFIHRVAEERFNGWRKRKRFSQLLGDDRPIDMGEAYQVQSHVYQLMQERAGFSGFAGHKVALTSPAIQEMCGVDEPAYGSILTEYVHANNHEADLNNFIRMGIEFEVAVEIGEDLPLGRDFTKETVAEHISAVMPAFEMIDDRDADYAHLDAISLLADRCWCSGIVLGTRNEDWQHLDIGNLTSEVVWNGVADEKGHTGDALGHPLNSVAFVANHLGQRGTGLKAGEIIMTGSALKTRFPNPGDTATYRIDGLGEVSIRVKTHE
ncbi:MAG: fumarylacetoacetate hydrolase family protein [Rhizobiaceae bacterium]|nr:fumarylacetoacetate hydrolase family protein [Rhizobiaceae bacterium]